MADVSIDTGKKRCAKCDGQKSGGGLFTCDGCHQMFCARHVNEHRQELSNQLEITMQEHDFIQQELSRPSSDHTFFKRIDVWEKKSISQIQKAAETARVDLRQLLEDFNQRLSKSCQEVANNLRSARESDDFSEIDLQKWKKKLDELKMSIQSSVELDIVKDKRSAIYLIKILEQNAQRNDLEEKPSYVHSQVTSTANDKFGEVCGPVELDKSRMHGRFVDRRCDYGRIRGLLVYSQGRSQIRFKIEKSTNPQILFVGITTANATLNQRAWSASSTIGWCGENNVWQHGAFDELLDRSDQDKFQMGDVLQLILDCNQQLIELVNARTQTVHVLRVDLNKTPFPWQFLIGLRSDGDYVRIVQ